MHNNKQSLKSSMTITCILFSALLAGCVQHMSAAQHQQSLGSTQEREMTVGVVQKEIRVGMSQADVAETLGSPNIVTKDSYGDETWIFDKIATEASYSNSSQSEGVGVGGAAGGFLGNVLLLGGVGYSMETSSQAGASATTQKTLTVVIKFDKKSLVKGFSYHASKF